MSLPGLAVVRITSSTPSGMSKKNKKAAKSQGSTKSKANKARPTPSGPKPPKSASKSNQHSKVIEDICGVVNPFCESAYGAKVFDLGRVRTISLPYIARISFSTDAGGMGAMLFTPQYTNEPFIQGVMTGADASYTNYQPRAVSNVVSWRCVTFGLIIRAVQSPLNQAGTVHLRLFSPKTGYAMGTVNVSTYNCDQFYDIPVHELGQGFPVILPRLDAVADLLQDQGKPSSAGGLVTNWVSTGWPMLQVGVTGGSLSTYVLDITVYQHTEVVFQDNEGLSQLGTFTVPTTPALKGAVTQVQSSLGAFASKSIEAVATKVTNSAASALANALRFGA